MKSEKHMKSTWEVKSTWNAHLKSEKHLTEKWKGHEKHTSQVKRTWKAPERHVQHMHSLWPGQNERFVFSSAVFVHYTLYEKHHAFCEKHHFLWKAPLFERPLARNCNPMFVLFPKWTSHGIFMEIWWNFQNLVIYAPNFLLFFGHF